MYTVTADDQGVTIVATGEESQFALRLLADMIHHGLKTMHKDGEGCAVRRDDPWCKELEKLAHQLYEITD